MELETKLSPSNNILKIQQLQKDMTRSSLLSKDLSLSPNESSVKEKFYELKFTINKKKTKHELGQYTNNLRSFSNRSHSSVSKNDFMSKDKITNKSYNNNSNSDLSSLSVSGLYRNNQLLSTLKSKIHKEKLQNIPNVSIDLYQVKQKVTQPNAKNIVDNIKLLTDHKLINSYSFADTNKNESLSQYDKEFYQKLMINLNLNNKQIISEKRVAYDSNNKQNEFIDFNVSKTNKLEKAKKIKTAKIMETDLYNKSNSDFCSSYGFAFNLLNKRHNMEYLNKDYSEFYSDKKFYDKAENHLKNKKLDLISKQKKI